jgi:hypothetical protein
MANICVYCGAANNVAAKYITCARETGMRIAERGHTLVYGGADRGLMGEAARATHAHGSKVIGVIPQALVDLEQAYREADELHITDGLRERKAILESRADGFMIIPGGLGTLDELFEVLTLRQLRLHNKPIVIVDLDGYYQPLLRLIEHLHAEGFVKETYKLMFEMVPDPLSGIKAIEDYKPIDIGSRF